MDPIVVVVAASAMLALPFGWGLGLLAAYLIAPRDIGMWPVVTLPLGIGAALVFALAPVMPASKRFAILLGGALMFVAYAWLAG